MLHRRLTVLWIAALLAGCAGSESSAGGDTSRRDSVATDRSAAPPARDPVVSPAQGVALERAAGEVVSFLAGDASFERLALADTVELHLPPEGAGTATGATVRLGRDALRDRSAWRIGAAGRSFSFVPPASLTKRTIRAGTHFHCRETPLASRMPALAARPHVGVRLEPVESKSCLDLWHATFLFDTSASRPRLVGAVYDQWEW